MVINCPECGHQVSDQAATCPSCGIAIAKKTKKKKNVGRIVLVTSFVLAVIIVVAGVYIYNRQEEQNELHAYERALQSDQPAVLQNYLDMFTQAPQAHRDSVAARIVLLRQVDVDWENALASGLKSELEKFMQRHPNSIHNVEARLQIDSIDWATACAANTSEAYQAYLTNHYEGAHYDEAMNAFDHAREVEEARRRQAVQDSIRRADSIRQASLIIPVEE